MIELRTHRQWIDFRRACWLASPDEVVPMLREAIEALAGLDAAEPLRRAIDEAQLGWSVHHETREAQDRYFAEVRPSW
jgi:hypothetical protein